MKKRLTALLLILAFAASSLTSCVEVVKIEEEDKPTEEVTFNADSSVESIWQSRAVPKLTKKAMGPNAFLTELRRDPKTLADKYEKYSMGASDEPNYMVEGAVEVIEVDRARKVGIMDVELQGYDGLEIIQLQIGSVFKGSAVCDFLDFIKYEDYKNQVQWTNASQSTHTVIQEQALDPLDASSLTGKTVEFIGCFTVDSNGKLFATLVQMAAK